MTSRFVCEILDTCSVYWCQQVDFYNACRKLYLQTLIRDHSAQTQILLHLLVKTKQFFWEVTTVKHWCLFINSRLWWWWLRFSPVKLFRPTGSYSGFQKKKKHVFLSTSETISWIPESSNPQVEQRWVMVSPWSFWPLIALRSCLFMSGSPFCLSHAQGHTCMRMWSTQYTLCQWFYIVPLSYKWW